jgi:hypothetical protein
VLSGRVVAALIGIGGALGAACGTDAPPVAAPDTSSSAAVESSVGTTAATVTTAESESTEGPATPSTSTTTAAAATTTPATTAVTTTTTAPPTTAPPTTAPPTTAATARAPSQVLHVDVAPFAFPLEQVPPCDLETCPSIGHLDDGTIVLYDDVANAFEITGGATPRRVEVQEPLPGTSARIAHIGPDDVAYLVADAGSPDPYVVVIAVALQGPHAGAVVARSNDDLDGSGDTDFVPSRHGLVAVGCCGSPTVRPDPNGTVVLPWVDSNGSATIDEGPQMSIELHPRDSGAPDVEVVRRDAAVELRWWLPSGVAGTIRGMPPLEAQGDGGATLLNWDMGPGEPRLFTLEPSGAVEAVAVPDGWIILHLLPYAVVIAHDGERLLYWQLGTFTEGRDALDLVVETFGGTVPTAATPDELIEMLLAGYRSPPEQADEDCAELAAATGRVDAADTVMVTIEHRVGCDDSGAGSNYDLTLARNGAGTWSVVAATERSLCRRGGDSEFCL